MIIFYANYDEVSISKIAFGNHLTELKIDESKSIKDRLKFEEDVKEYFVSRG